MSNQPNEVFIFVSPDFASAKYFAKNNFRFKESAVLEVNISGNLLSIEGSHPDYEVFRIVSDLLGVRSSESTSLYDEKMIAHESLERIIILEYHLRIETQEIERPGLYCRNRS